MTKHVLMLRDDYGAPNGIDIVAYREGTAHHLPVVLADIFVEIGSAKEVGDQAELPLTGATPAPAAGSEPAREVAAEAGRGLTPAVPQPPARSPVPAQPRAPAPASAQPSSLEKARAAKKAKAPGSLSGSQNKSLTQDDK